jgi:hypothetical protein
LGARDLLRDLDRRLLPPLASRLDRLAGGGWMRRRRPRPLTVAALASAAAVAAAAVWSAVHQPPPDPSAATVARVGVVDGQSVPAYVAASRSELAHLVAGAAGRPARPTYALVTLAAYLPPERLAQTLAGVDVARVHTRVPLPDQQTAIGQIPVTRVPGDVIAGMVAVAAGKDQEAKTYQSLSAKLSGDEQQEQRLRAVYSGQAQLAAAEAAAYRSRCSCVYAAVVRGAPAALQGVAGRPQVRAVDPAPEVRQLDRAVFLPPLPEQTGTVRSPAEQPVQPSLHAVPRRDLEVQPASPDRPPAAPATSGATAASATDPPGGGSGPPAGATASPAVSPPPDQSTPPPSSEQPETPSPSADDSVETSPLG